MPCWQERTQTVAVDKMNLDILAAALKSLGYVVTGTPEIVQATHPAGGATALYRKGAPEIVLSANTQVNSIKRAYTKEAFRMAAKASGFSVKEEAGKLVAVRRRYGA